MRLREASICNGGWGRGGGMVKGEVRDAYSTIKAPKKFSVGWVVVV